MCLFMDNNDNLQETFSSFIQISVSGSDDYIKVRCLLRLDRPMPLYYGMHLPVCQTRILNRNTAIMKRVRMK